ncbi:MAG TPA: MFS transporter [Syntrophorhabdaceae bacterium]|nr:MFS transporter [Syntrophorhabdaceae bacterium]
MILHRTIDIFCFWYIIPTAYTKETKTVASEVSNRKTTNQELWNKNFLIIILVNFLVALNVYLVLTITSLFAVEVFRSSPSQAGLATGIFILGGLVARLFSGKWMEKLGRRRMLNIGLLSVAVASSIYLAVNNILLLVVVRVLHGAAFGIAATATNTIVASIIPRERSGEGLGYFMLSVTLATAIGPFLGMFISQSGNYTLIFAGCTISAVLGLISALSLSIDEIDLSKEQRDAMKGLNLNSFIEPKAVPVSIICGIIYFCYSTVLSFLAVYSKEIHLVDAAGVFFIVYAVSVLFSRPFVGRLFDTKGENFTMYPAILVFVAGMAVLSYAHSAYLLLLAGVFLGLGSGAVQSTSQAVTVRVTPPHRMGLAASTFWVFNDAGLGLGPLVLGLFIPSIGYRNGYLSMAIISLMCALLYYIMHGRMAEPPNKIKITS